MIELPHGTASVSIQAGEPERLKMNLVTEGDGVVDIDIPFSESAMVVKRLKELMATGDAIGGTEQNPHRTLVLAGDYGQFKAWCHHNHVPRHNARYVTNAGQLRGHPEGTEVLIFGTASRRQDYDECIDYIDQHPGLSYRFDPYAPREGVAQEQ